MVCQFADGIWLPSESQGFADFTYAWDSMHYMEEQQFYGTWALSSKVPVQTTESTTPLTQSPTSSLTTLPPLSDTMSNDSFSDSKPHRAAQMQKAQTAARAAKRQRGRERRKMYRASARLQKLSGEEVDSIETFIPEGAVDLSRKFDRLVAVVAELPLVVKRTFYEIEEPAASPREDIVLPAAFFKSTEEIDDWRRDYRRFRMGHHQGANLEITALSFPHESSACSSKPFLAKGA
jgi:hypothetical protein